MLDCYPVATKNVEVVDDSMKLDTTGRYLIVGNKRPKLVPPTPDEIVEQRELFINNAFYLLAHKERILSDSRMFLCPVAVQNGVMYTGTSGFTRPTLGIYLEWWAIAPETMMIDEKGRKRLVYCFGGSPLSGINRSGSVYETGERETISLSSFGNHWGPFMLINRRYNDAKYLYQAFSLQDVLDILKKEDEGNKDYSHVIETLYMKHEINELNRENERLYKECNNWGRKYYDLLVSCHEEEVRAFCAEYKELKSNSNMEIEQLKKQKKELKVALKCGQMDNIAYQKKLTPVKKRIMDIKYGLNDFKYKRLHEVFPNDNIPFYMIEQYINKKENNS